MKLIRVWLIAQFVVFLHLASLIRSLTDPSNRYDYIWGRHQSIALVVLLLVAGGGAALAALALRSMAQRLSRPALGRSLDACFLLLLFSGILAAVPTFAIMDHRTATELLWLLAMAYAGYYVARPTPRVLALARNACLIFSPAAFILAVQVLYWPTWQQPPTRHAQMRVALGQRAPVFLFVFDEWSCQRSMAGREFLPFFANIRRLAQRSVVVTHALSPYHYTRQSVPMLLYTTDLKFGQEGAVGYFDHNGRELLSTDATSLFERGKREGYNTYMLGWGLPFERILGSQVDYCHSYHVYPEGDTICAEMGYMVCRALRYWSDPISQRLWRTLPHRQMAEFRFRTNKAMQAEMLDILRTCPMNSFAVFHLPIPHDPFIWDEKGNYRGLRGSGPLPVGYQRNLKYLDFYVGEIMRTLEDAGKLKPALLILTSDHSFRAEEEPDIRAEPEWIRSVPLIIKLPNQESGRIIDQQFCTRELLPLLQAVWSGEQDDSRLLRVVEETVGRKRPLDHEKPEEGPE